MKPYLLMYKKNRIDNPVLYALVYANSLSEAIEKLKIENNIYTGEAKSFVISVASATIE